MKIGLISCLLSYLRKKEKSFTEPVDEASISSARNGKSGTERG